jgi:hypothetical protein
MRATLETKRNLNRAARTVASPQIRGCNQIGAIISRLPPILDVGLLAFWKVLAWGLHGCDPQYNTRHFDIQAGIGTVHGLVDFDMSTNCVFVQPKPCLTRIGAVALGLSNAPVADRPVVGAMVLDSRGEIAFAGGELLQKETSRSTDAIFLADGASLCEVPNWWRFKRYSGKDDRDGSIDMAITEKVRIIVDRGVRELA